jgi:[glutamine synthetase] adenylyltransferase / [glutamine synthetase]-adenylyl-L-tyrosine phosphorylase
MISKWLAPGPAILPRPGDPAAVDVFMRRWFETASRNDDPEISAFAQRVADDEHGAALLRAVFGNSPFLGQCMLADMAFTRELFCADPGPVFERILAGAAAGDDFGGTIDDLMQSLRIARRRVALTVGLADICGAWELEKVTLSLSRFAETALRAACAHLLAQASRTGELALSHPDDPERESGLIVLGMGKLGAGELNYSSDIDLIILFEHDRIEYTGKASLQQYFVRFARGLVRIMDERTKDGYVFRTDLRLRPDPGSTPPAISTLAAEQYYESTGQNWERAAMIKARPVAGDIVAGERFLGRLKPFIWRKNLDFAAIQDIHSIKRQINAHRGGAEIALAGHNVKLGRGGIREIEFFAQTQQLIWGGRDPRLRPRSTFDTLDALVATGRVENSVATDLKRAYEFLRRLEHRLQMVDDSQTHSLPESDAGLSAVAAFMGYQDRDGFLADLLTELRTVETHYAELFEESTDLGSAGNLVFTGADDDPDTLTTLKKLGFREPTVVSARIRAWHHGRYGAMRSARARELLTELTPRIFEAMSRTINPDAALLRFDGFLGALPAGVQLFSLFQNNPGLLDLVAEIMGSAPRLAEWLSRHPILLDGVLTQGFFDPLPDADALGRELGDSLAQGRDFQDALDIVRRWANDRIFQLGVQMLRARMDPESAGLPLSDVADVTLRALLPAVEREFGARHGGIPGGGMAVVAFGKLGGCELTVGSDLDLLFVYRAPDGVDASDGDKPLTPTLYFSRLSQRLISAVSAPTGEGRLFEVDMRLRPSGNAGPIATSLEAFARYQREDAWTWEHMALTRARVVIAPDGLASDIEATIHEVLTAPRDADGLLRDVADMRARIAREHEPGNVWNVKYCRGGLVDIEFIAQYLQLRHGHDHPSVLAGNTTVALTRLAKAGVLDPAIADDLIGAMKLWRNVQAVLRLTLETRFDEAAAPDGLRAALARGAGADDFDSLRADMFDTASRAHGHFTALIEQPAGALEPSQ